MTKNFINKLNLINPIEFDIEEIGKPIPFNWGKCKLATTSYGHGITTTMLQLANAYSIIVNGGYEINPTLIKMNNYKKKKKILNNDVSKKINPILRKIVTTKEGTASLANVEGYEVGGKTGTAQVKKITKRDRELDLKTFEIPYEERDHAFYVAYGPYKNPRYAVSVIVEHGGNGSTTAAPMAKKLFKLIIDRHEKRQSMDDKKYLEI